MQVNHRLTQLSHNRQSQRPRNFACFPHVRSRDKPHAQTFFFQQTCQITRRHVLGDNEDVSTMLAHAKKLQHKRMPHLTVTSVHVRREYAASFCDQPENSNFSFDVFEVFFIVQYDLFYR
jgi:hypothetical protein